MIRVLLADDQALLRAGFRMLLASEPDIEIVAEAGDGESAIAEARQHRPDVALMDIRMPVLDGIQATARISSDRELASVHVLVLTTFEADEYVFQALRAGAAGFVLKDIEPEELLRAVRVVARGDALLAPSVTRRLIAEFAVRAGTPQRQLRDLSELTDREREVLQLVGRGLSNDEIATGLFVSPATVKTHIGRILSKLEARDRAQLVVAAYEGGLVVAGD